MRKEADKDIEQQIIDAIMERPVAFKIEGCYFYVYPLTLGKTFILQRLMRKAGLNIGNLQKGMNLEFLRVVRESKDVCCELMSYLTARNEYYDIFDYKALEERKALFEKLSDDELASFMIMAMTADKTETFVKHLGIDKEQKDMRKVMDVKSKNDKNTFSFGGLSLYGSLLDMAMERYSLTKRQVVWEIDYTSLRLLLTDRVNTVYVTDAERKKIHIPRDRKKINGDNKEELMRFIKSQDWE